MTAYNNKKLLIIYLFILFFLILLTIFFIVSRFIPDNFIMEFFDDFAGKEGAYVSFLDRYIIPLILYLGLALVLLWILSSFLKALKKNFSESVVNTLNVIGRMIIIPFCVIAYLNNFPTFQGTLIGIAAIVGAAIGFASTNTIGNLLAGLYMLITRPFIIGDYIIIGGLDIEGVVTEISINYTTIEKSDGAEGILPNITLLNRPITNIKHEIQQKSDQGDYAFITKLHTTITRKNIKNFYVYPLRWSSNTDEKGEGVEEAITKTAEQLKSKLAGEVYWFITRRERWNRNYQINLPVENSKTLLTLIGEFQNVLEKNYEKLRKPI